MEASGFMGKKKPSCLYPDAQVVETARKLGLNISKVSENALKKAIGRLKDPRLENGLNSARF